MVTVTEELLLVAADGTMVSYKSDQQSASSTQPLIILAHHVFIILCQKASAMNVFSLRKVSQELNGDY